MIRTKIVATIGPASEKKAELEKMMKAGLDVCRLNFSHGTYSHHLKLIRNIRGAARRLGRAVAIIQDLQGPRIRIGEVAAGGVKVKKGEGVVLFYAAKTRNQENKKSRKQSGLSQPTGRGARIPIHYQNLYRDLKPGERVLIADGVIQLKVKKIINREIYCVVTAGGLILSHKGLNFPDSRLKAESVTAKDLADLAFGIKNRVDFVALSFVKDARDVYRLKKRIFGLEKKYGDLAKGQKAPQTKIIAKIERREAVKNIDSILKAADAVMVARGDLGLELPFEKVPLLQKEIIKKASYAGKPVIVATQMMESMIKNPLPTRAEVSDVANAIIDGTDAVMLSGESATGQYPLEAVTAMNRIARELEPAEFKLQQELEAKLKRIKSAADFAAYNAQDLAEKNKCRLMVCFTRDGQLARLISRYKSKVPLITASESEAVRNQLGLSWGIEAYQVSFGRSYHETWGMALKLLKKNKKVKARDSVLVCADVFGRKEQIKIEKV